MKHKYFQLRQFSIITLITSIPIIIGELLRAGLVVLPRMQVFFEGKLTYGEITPSSPLIVLGMCLLLTAVLVFTVWLCIQAFGNNGKAVIIAGTLVLISTLGLYWIANVATGLGDWTTAFIVYPLGWIQFVISAWVASKLYATERWAT